MFWQKVDFMPGGPMLQRGTTHVYCGNQPAGSDVYGTLRWESGIHRVQRVPTTETSGRVHTSAASVVVLAEADQVGGLLQLCLYLDLSDGSFSA